MKESTINGKPLTLIYEELGMRTPQKISSKAGKPYVDISEYNRALNDIIGLTHYCHFIVGQPQIVTLPDQEMITTVIVEIVLYDDNGNVAAMRRSPGSAKFEVIRDTGTYSWPTNVVTSAYANALKNACKSFGLFSNISTNSRKADNSNSRSSKRESSENAGRAITAGAETLTVFTKGTFIVKHKEGCPDVYKISVIDNGLEKDLVIYSGKVEPDYLKGLLNDTNIGTGVRHKIECTARSSHTAGYDKPQLILQKLISYKSV